MKTKAESIEESIKFRNNQIEENLRRIEYDLSMVLVGIQLLEALYEEERVVNIVKQCLRGKWVITWPDFKFPGVNLYNYPNQNRDFKMNISEETTVRPVWEPKMNVDTISTEYLNKRENDTQVEGDHYKNMSIEPWDVMEAVLTTEEFVGFLKGNIINYAMRDGKKEGSVNDAAKAKHYQAKLTELKIKILSEW